MFPAVELSIFNSHLYVTLDKYSITKQSTSDRHEIIRLEIQRRNINSLKSLQ